MMSLSLKQIAFYLLIAVIQVLLPAQAARVSDLYAAEVPLAANTQPARNDAYNAALARVVVKVTGSEAAAAQAGQWFPDASRLLERYRLLNGDAIRVEFNPDAVRRGLDAAGQPVWNAERPSVLVWLAVEEGGTRNILGANASEPAVDKAQGQRFEAWRDQLVAAGNDRGLPLVLPLVDAEDLSKISFADLWGGFPDVALAASERYRADVVLIGRLRSGGAAGAQVRWLMLADGRSSEWRGSIADGPSVAADTLGSALATYAASAGTIPVTVRGLNNFDDYAAVLAYLRSLSLVEDAAVSRVLSDAVEFAITARADSSRLDRAIRRNHAYTTAKQVAGSDGGLMSYRLGDGLIYDYR